MMSLKILPLLLFAAVAVITLAVPGLVQVLERRRVRRATRRQRNRRARLVLIKGGRQDTPAADTDDAPKSRIA